MGCGDGEWLLETSAIEFELALLTALPDIALSCLNQGVCDQKSNLHISIGPTYRRMNGFLHGRLLQQSRWERLGERLAGLLGQGGPGTPRGPSADLRSESSARVRRHD